MATLMREGSRIARERVFDAAYDAGVRHFDVAPLYGLGEAEKELGRLLARASGATVATKFGLQVSPAARAVAKVQAPLRQLLTHSSRLRSLARASIGSAVPVQAPHRADILSSLDRSRHYLGVDHIDVLLLHDLAWGPQVSELWADLNAVRPPNVGCIGIAGDSNILSSYPVDALAKADVLQVPGNMRLASSPKSEALQIQYGLLSTSLEALNSWLDEDVQRRKMLEDLLDFGLRDRSERISFLCALALSVQDKSILLFGTTKPSRISRVCGDIPQLLSVLAQRRAEFRLIVDPARSTRGVSLMDRVFCEQ